MSKKENVNKYLQSDIIRKVSNHTGYTQESILEVIHGLEHVINNMVLDAEPDKDITIYPITGVRLTSKYRERTTRNFGTRGDIVIPEGVTISAGITKDYRRVRNEDYQKTYKISKD